MVVLKPVIEGDVFAAGEIHLDVGLEEVQGDTQTAIALLCILQPVTFLELPQKALLIPTGLAAASFYRVGDSLIDAWTLMKGESLDTAELSLDLSIPYMPRNDL